MLLTADGLPTVWVPAARLHEVLRYLKHEAPKPYKMLYDLTAIDERFRKHREGQPKADFTLVYQLLSVERDRVTPRVTHQGDVRLKVALQEKMITDYDYLPLPLRQ